nr:MAG TPA: hypothetical protein [Caudoviricetes sp.]
MLMSGHKISPELKHSGLIFSDVEAAAYSCREVEKGRKKRKALIPRQL